MAQTFADSLQEVIELCQQRLTAVTIARHTIREHVALVEIHVMYGRYAIHIREVCQADGVRKYAYYALQNDQVVVGFDNVPDPQALKLKYGALYTAHRLERIPHQHTAQKTAVMLTEEVACAHFLDWLMANLI
ncbi:MAG: hypothetical protein IAE79_03180 [Anaerolinea sp.]|nr:hypothetical protein [Anaerolinea sp.]